MIIANVTVSLRGRRCFIFVCFSFLSFSFYKRGNRAPEVKELLRFTQLLSEGSAVGKGWQFTLLRTLPAQPVFLGDSLVSCSA